MRLPYTIPSHTFEAYRCSEETILLPGEQNRTLRSEDARWDESGVPAELKTQALDVIARNWCDNPILDELPTTVDRDYLLEVLPVKLPFELAITKIPYEHFWQRASEDRWKFNDPAEHGGSWRRLYCERHLSEYLEGLDPTYFDSERDEVERLLELVHEHVRTLKLRQLKPYRIEMTAITPEPAMAPDYEEEDDSPADKSTTLCEPQVHHISLDVVCNKLPLLTEIYINIGMIHSTDGSEWRDFEFSLEDSVKIGRGAKNLEHLTKFGLTRSHLDRPRAAAILHGLAVNNNIVEIDFSHCKLGDSGAHAIGAFVKQRRRLRQPGRLKVLRLISSGIGPDGMAGLVHGLLADLEDEPASPTSIRRLDLRLNPLGDDGAVHVAAMLLRYDALEYLNISACGMGGDGGMGLAEVLASGRTKFSDLQLDCSNNDFGTIVGEAFEIVAKACIAITELDARMCGFRKESEYSITQSINRNRMSKKKQKTIERRSSSVQLKRMPSLVPPEEFLINQERHTRRALVMPSKSVEIGFITIEDNDGEEDEGEGASEEAEA